MSGAVALAALATLTACSDDGDTSSAAPTSSAPAVDPSLRVPAPLNAERVSNDPCSVIAEADASAAGLASPGTVFQTPAGIGCRWQGSKYDTNKIFISPLTSEHTGLSGIYANRAQDKYFEPANIEGYPAVFAAQSDLRSHGTCVLWVAVTDELAVSVNSSILDGSSAGDPCPVVQQVATAMIRNLEGAGAGA